MDLTRSECLYSLEYPHRKSSEEKRLAEAGVPRAARCTSCGADLSDELKRRVLPMDCLYSGIVCGFPCGRHRRKRRPGDLVCEKQVPLGRIGSMPEAVAESKRREEALAMRKRQLAPGAKMGPGKTARIRGAVVR